MPPKNHHRRIDNDGNAILNPTTGRAQWFRGEEAVSTPPPDRAVLVVATPPPDPNDPWIASAAEIAVNALQEQSAQPAPAEATINTTVTPVTSTTHNVHTDNASVEPQVVPTGVSTALPPSDALAQFLQALVTRVDALAARLPSTVQAPPVLSPTVAAVPNVTPPPVPASTQPPSDQFSWIFVPVIASAARIVPNAATRPSWEQARNAVGPEVFDTCARLLRDHQGPLLHCRWYVNSRGQNYIDQRDQNNVIDPHLQADAIVILINTSRRVSRIRPREEVIPPTLVIPPPILQLQPNVAFAELLDNTGIAIASSNIANAAPAASLNQNPTRTLSPISNPTGDERDRGRRRQRSHSRRRHRSSRSDSSSDSSRRKSDRYIRVGNYNMPKFTTPESKWLSPHLYLRRAQDMGIPLNTVAAEWLVDARHALTRLKAKLSEAGSNLWDTQASLFVGWMNGVTGNPNEQQWEVARGILTQMVYQIAIAHSGVEGANALKIALDNQVDTGKFFLQKALNKVLLAPPSKKQAASDPANHTNTQRPTNTQRTSQQGDNRNGDNHKFFRKGRR